MTELIETGREPEFFISDIQKWEITGGGALLRLYVSCEKQGHAILQFTVVASLSDFAKMARQVLEASAGQHDTPPIMSAGKRH